MRGPGLFFIRSLRNTVQSNALDSHRQMRIGPGKGAGRGKEMKLDSIPRVRREQEQGAAT